MLKGIPKILSPELLKVLAEMGHSDRLVIADGNFPAETMGKKAIVIRCDGHGVPELLDAILQVFPLDTYVDKPVNLMEVMPGDDVETPIWDTYKEIVKSTTAGARTPSDRLNGLHSTGKRKRRTRLSPPENRRCMPTSCCRRAL